MTVEAAMEEIGQCPSLLEGSAVWFAKEGWFTDPGLYVWDGKSNHLIVRWADLSIAMSAPDASEEQPQVKRRWWHVIVRDR